MMSSEELLYVIRSVLKEYDKKADERSMREIAAKDRVDISLERYMELINVRDRLRNELASYKMIFGGITLGPDIRVIPWTVTVETCTNDSSNSDRTRKYRIEFQAKEL
jgi:hypothetical protein